MTLKKRIAEQIRRISTLTPPRGEFSLDTEQGRLTCDLQTVEALACSFTHLELESGVLAGANSEQLKAVSDGLSSRLTYLLEPVRVIEFDQDANLLQMRSDPPSQEESGTSYYELNVSHHGIAIRRYQKVPGQPRAQVAANVTHEVLVRLASDFIAALA